MVSHRFLVVRLRKQHFDRVQNDAAAKGYENVSEYIRSMLFVDDISMHQKVSKIYNILVGNDEQKKTIKEKPLLAYIK